MLEAVALVEMALSNCAGVKVGATAPSPSKQGSSSSSEPSLLMRVHPTTYNQAMDIGTLSADVFSREKLLSLDYEVGADNRASLHMA